MIAVMGLDVGPGRPSKEAEPRRPSLLLEANKHVIPNQPALAVMRMASDAEQRVLERVSMLSIATTNASTEMKTTAVAGCLGV